MNEKEKQEKLKEAMEEYEKHQSHSQQTHTHTGETNVEKESDGTQQVENKVSENEVLKNKEDEEKNKTEWQKLYKKGEECHKRTCFLTFLEIQSLKKDVDKIKRLHIGEMFNRFYVMKQTVAMWMNCYGQDIMKEIFGQMKNEMEAINKGDYKTLKDDKGNEIKCFGCKKPVVVWAGLKNRASDGNDYCFGCFNAKFPEEWKKHLAVYQEAEEKKRQEAKNEKHENLSENRKAIELKLNGVSVGSFFTEKKEESYKVSDIRISWDDNKYNIVLGTNTVIVDRDKVEGKEIEKSFSLEIIENGKLVDSRRISKNIKQNNEVKKEEK